VPRFALADTAHAGFRHEAGLPDAEIEDRRGEAITAAGWVEIAHADDALRLGIEDQPRAVDGVAADVVERATADLFWLRIFSRSRLLYENAVCTARTLPMRPL